MNVARAGIAFLMSLAAAIICTSYQAHAFIVIVTMTGTVTGGPAYDTTGVFGPPNGDITGAPYSAVFTIDSTKGVPNGNQSACDNGLKNSELNSPVTQAVLTINGKSYVYHLSGYDGSGVSSLSSGIYAGSATSPKISLGFGLNEYFDFINGIWGSETIGTELNLNGPSITCRNWADAFNYTLQSGPDSYVGGTGFGINISKITSTEHVQLAKAGGYMSVERVTVSGPLSAACVADVESGKHRATLSGRLLSHSALPIHISNSFTPDVGISQAKIDCDVTGFDWVQTVALPPPVPIHACADINCSTQIPVSPNTVVNDPPQYGWPYCFNSSCRNSPYLYPPSVASLASAAQSYCIEQASIPTFQGVPPINICASRLQFDDVGINYFDEPDDVCLVEDNLLGNPEKSNVYKAGLCGNTFSSVGAKLYFTTQLVGISKTGPPLFLPYIFRWTDSFNGVSGGIVLQ